jgi:hypothetical protein
MCLFTITHNGLRLKKEGIESTTLPPTTKLYRMHNCSITTKAPLSFKRVLAAVASTNVHSRHEPFFLKTFLGEVFIFLFSCVYQIHYVYLHRNNLITKIKIKWKQ